MEDVEWTPLHFAASAGEVTPTTPSQALALGIGLEAEGGPSLLLDYSHAKGSGVKKSVNTSPPRNRCTFMQGIGKLVSPGVDAAALRRVGWGGHSHHLETNSTGAARCGHLCSRLRYVLASQPYNPDI